MRKRTKLNKKVLTNPSISSKMSMFFMYSVLLYVVCFLSLGVVCCDVV